MQTLEWQGPYSALPGQEPSIFTQGNVVRPGVYLWTVYNENAYWVNYVGIASLSLVQRTADHLASYFKGAYTIYDADKMVNLELCPIYDGGSYDSFQKDYEILAPQLIGNLKLYHLFYCTCECDKTDLENIESAIICRLRMGPHNVCKRFLTNQRVSRTGGKLLEYKQCFAEGVQVMGLS